MTITRGVVPEHVEPQHEPPEGDRARGENRIPEDSSGGAPDPGENIGDTGCGCHGAPGASGLPALLAALLLRRRSRPR
ncbi:Myxococcales GC_trans_RRR domain-containing protein [Nannocystis exedens]|uniref:Myxococcales GC_trans_RRR domain-containing protein n=1 Tax=Nannocystis exedens TaxID=54 RepID=A0A1I2IRU9_9BACT|nr:MYXO-CTERM sorting domain-containing protein [Nannocystis exedens]PCC69287.1 hypothetical protein NAEX_02309 [Nannocystis exedens]SFF44440.1 Myxococcales GC_trans_RRR domain-containing protein [Nannocystis exedens]